MVVIDLKLWSEHQLLTVVVIQQIKKFMLVIWWISIKRIHMILLYNSKEIVLNLEQIKLDHRAIYWKNKMLILK